MKKKLISFLVLISTFLFIGNVQAIEIDKDDIETGSYVIGTHLFERKVTEHYDGTLTVQHIMLAAQSIGSNDINDMVIYLKNSRGKWVNGLTNESITVPENFEIEYKNVEKISEFASYGDVNSDGKIDIFDAVAVLQYIDGQIEFSEEQKKSADVNADGKISIIDKQLILGFDLNYFPNTLPSKPITDYILYGDVLDSGDPYADKEGGMPIYVMQQYLKGNTSSLEGQALKNADINGDGKVDHIDSAIIFWYVNDRLDITLPSFTPITDYTLYGDVTNDGVVNDKDSELLSKFISNKDTLSKQGFKNADINADGSVDNADLEILNRAIEIDFFDGDIPAIKPIHKYIIMFDSNGGSDVPNSSAITYDKVGEPEVPTKEGYVFQGWYLNDGLYNFESYVTSDITLVAKWGPIKYNVAYVNTCGDSHKFENNSTLNFVGSGSMIQQTSLEYDKAYGISENNYKCSATVSFVTGTNEVIEDKTVSAHFKGWSTDKVDGVVTHPYNGEIINLSNTNQTVYLYTVWGSQYDESTIVLPDPGTKEGYWFRGWYSDSEFNNQVGGTGGNYYATSGTTLYAKWEPIIYSLVYNKNASDANGIISPGPSCTYDQDCILTSQEFTRSHYVFAGWSTTSDGEVEYSSNSLVARNLSTVNGDKVTLYAVWNPVEYSITYNLNGGTALNPTSYNIESESFTLNNPTRDGYTFAGWTTKADGSDNPKLSITIPKGSTGNRIYTANWEEIVYAVSFEDYDGRSLGETQYIKTGESAIEPKRPYREDYMFTGWDNDYNNITGPLTVKATYQLNNVCFIYDAEGKITGYDEVLCGTDVTIPEKINDTTVTNIYNNAFYNKGLMNVDFSHATGLTTLSNGSFSANSLTSVKITSSIEVIEARAFAHVGAHTPITVLDLSEATNLKRIESFAFDGAEITSLIIPSSLEFIGNGAFESNEISNIDFSNATSLTTISAGAFYSNNIEELDLSGAKNLQIIDGGYYDNTVKAGAFQGNPIKNLNISSLSSLMTIGELAFAGAQLTNVEIPASVTSIGTAAFNKYSTYSNPNLTTIVNNSEVTNWDEITGGSNYSGEKTGIVVHPNGDITISSNN